MSINNNVMEKSNSINIKFLTRFELMQELRKYLPQNTLIAAMRCDTKSLRTLLNKYITEKNEVYE